MAVDQFCLKWNNFQTSIITAFESLQTTEDLADVTLTCEGINLKAHKIILSACSPYFRTVFKENPCPHPIVILKDVLYTDLLAVLNFMYHGEVLIAKDQLKSFLQTAEILQVSGLIGSTDFTPKTFPTSVKTTIKSSKLGRVPELIEPAAKKAKISTKLKANKTPANSDVPINNAHQKAELQSNDKPVDVNAICVDEIKVEDGTSTESNESTDAILRCAEQQSSILEAVLEMKDQPSILERSLTVAAKSPSSAAPYLTDHATTLLSTPETSKSSFSTKKSPETFDKIIIKPPDTINQASFDLTNENLPNIKTEEQSPKSVELCTDTVLNAQSELSALKSAIEVQPHHSSQCGNCPHCGKVYSNQSALKYHVRLVHSDLTNMYCCHLCPESFDYREGYKKHMIEAHSIRN